MGTRVLAICCTPYQLLVAAQVLAVYYPEAQADLIISDQMNNARRLWEQAKEVWPRGRVYYLEEKQLNRLARGKVLGNILEGAAAPRRLLRRFLPLEGAYDVFLFSNISLMNQYLILGLKAENPRLTWMLFEDGAETYSLLVGSLVQSASLKVRLQLYAVQQLKGAYLFHPETLDWKPACPVYKLPGEYAPETLALLNRIFQYDRGPDRYDRPVVFFEESYPCDGVDIGDLALVNRLAELVGKENIFVKTHPRNQENRFKKAGYATNRDSTTPWELVILNTSFAHTLLVTVGSSAATNPFCIFGVPAKALFLCDLVEDPSKLRQKVLVQTRELCASRPDLFFFPKTWEECEEILSRQLNELTPQVKEVAS